MSDARRPRRVAESIRKLVADALSRELFDPALEGLMVTRVDVVPDLSLARIHVRSLLHGGDDKSRQRVESAANRAAPTLRRELGARVGLKRTPQLTFFYDEGQDAIDRVEAILGEIERERGPAED